MSRTCLLTVLLLCAFGAPAVRAQDQTSGDDARPMTQRMCERSSGSCDDMALRHEQCQKFPQACPGVTPPGPQPRSAAASTGTGYRPPSHTRGPHCGTRGHHCPR
ncbi:MAG TPA: hypothetical protein VHE37_11175 [Nevskiaceae bacterium]|nr:hypothetical protein [Nevskiaceae bacterium]